MDTTLTLKRKVKRKTKMEDLPPEVIQDILSMLPIKSLFQSRCVCPTWRNLVKEPRLANMHLAQAQQNPGAIIQSLKSLYVIPDCETCDAVTHLNKLPFKSWLPFFRVVGSCNGFICFADFFRYYRSMFICNPLTGEFMKVPDNAAVFGKVDGALFGFGFDPKRKEYKVVRMRFVDDDSPIVEAEVHTLGTDSWRSIGKMSNIVGMSVENSGVLVDGNLNWWGFSNILVVESIISFNVGDEKVRSIQLPPSLVPGRCTHIRLGSLSLGSLRGCLSVVDDRSGKCADVWVMKDYGVGESWTKLFVIRRPIDSVGPTTHILGVQKDGKILVGYKNQALYSYDPENERFKDLNIHGFPNVSRALPYVPSLVSLKDAFAPERLCEEKMKMERKRNRERLNKVKSK